MRRVFIIAMAAMLMIQINGTAQHRVTTQGRNTAAQTRDNRGNGPAVEAGRRGANETKNQPMATTGKPHNTQPNHNGPAAQTPRSENHMHQGNHPETVNPQPNPQMHKADAPKNRPNNHGYTNNNGIHSGRRGAANTPHNYGHAVPHLNNYNIITSAGNRYYYAGNTYYMLRNHEYVVCRPPLGTTVYLDARDLWMIRLGNKEYYFDDYGVFYRMKNNGTFKVVEAPIGAVIPFLPYDYTTVNMNGRIYYQVENVLYRAVNNWGETGYEIVRRILW